MTGIDTSTTTSGTAGRPRRPHALRSRLHTSSQDLIFGDPLRRFVLVSFALMGIALVMVAVAVARAPQMSITDEPAHAGYLYLIAHGQIPGAGTLIPKEIRYESYCHNLAGSTGSSVCTGFSTSGYMAGSQVYTFGDPPVYYLITGLLDRLISPFVPGTHNFITVGRDLGAVWLFAGMVVLYVAVRKFRVSWPYAFAAAALLPLCPGVLAASSQITSDAPAALCGALALYALARITVDRKLGLIVPFLLTMFTTGTKVLNGMPMLVVGGIALVMALAAARRRDWHSARRPFLLSVVIGLGFLVTYLGWNEYQERRADPNWINPNLGNGTALTGSPVGDLLSNLFGTFQHLTTSYWLAPQINGETMVIWATLLCVLFGAAPFVLMVVSRPRSWGWILGLSTFAGISAVALTVEAQVFTSNDQYFAIVAGRYALDFLPWAIVCLAVVAYRRRLLRTTFSFVSLGLAVMLLAEFGVLNLGPALSSSTSFLVG